MKLYTKILSLIVVALAAMSCGGNKGVAGMQAYELGEYDRAQKYLISAYQGEKNRYLKGQYAFCLAECYRHKGLYKKAASAYNRAVRANYADADALLRMGDCLRACGDTEGAAEAYAKYLIKKEGDLQAKAGVKSAQLLEQEKATMEAYDYKAAPDSGYVVQLAKAFNSKYSDYSLTFAGDDYDVVYFTSMRVAKRRRKMNRITGQGNSNIYTSFIDGKGEWTIPEALEEPFATQIDDGTPSVSADGKTMYFTRCPYTPDAENNAECYEVKRSGGRWGEPKRIIPGGDSAMMVAHPAISPDGNSLYFVSDKAGGIGGKDIYVTTKGDDGEWTTAENLGAMINTKGDEMFPYMRADGTLYFASTGHVGYGGLDIYRATQNETGRYVVENMGFPINSAGDDFGISFRGTKEEGFFSSNRANAKGIDNIYSFALPELVFMLEGSVTDPDGKAISGAFVRLVGTDGTNVKIRPTEDGRIGQTLDRDADYIVLCGAPGYMNQKHSLSTRGMGRSTTLQLKIRLQNAAKE